MGCDIVEACRCFNMHLSSRTSRVRSSCCLPRLFDGRLRFWHRLKIIECANVIEVQAPVLMSVRCCFRVRKKGPLRRTERTKQKLREAVEPHRPSPPQPYQQRGDLFLRLLCYHCYFIFSSVVLKRVNPTPLFEQKQHKSVVLERPPKSSEQNFPSEHDQYTHANTQTPHDESRADSCSSGIVVACLFPSVIICIVP